MIISVVEDVAQGKRPLHASRASGASQVFADHKKLHGQFVNKRDQSNIDVNSIGTVVECHEILGRQLLHDVL